MPEPNLVGSITFGERLDAQDKRIDMLQKRLDKFIAGQSTHIHYDSVCVNVPLDRVELAAKLGERFLVLAGVELSQDMAERIIAFLDQQGALRP